MENGLLQDGKLALSGKKQDAFMAEKELYTYYDIERISGDPSVRVKRYVDSSAGRGIHKFALGMHCIGEESFASGGTVENGLQPYYECSIISDGELSFRYGEQKKILKKGDVFLCHPRQNFFLENRGQETAVRKYIVFHPGPLVALLMDHGILAEMVLLNLSELQRVQEYFARIRQECEKQNEYTLHTISTLCYSLITEIARQCEWHDKSNEFKRITYLMARLPARKYTTSSLAADCGVSVRTLYNLFMKEKNCSPVEYLIQQRIIMAKWYLMREDLAVSDVANLCGYNNIPFFTREFKKRIGVTPAAFAREHRNKGKGRK